jgi:hypothetical protein
MGFLLSGKELAIQIGCLVIGFALIYKYCLDRFDKPVENLDDRWNFLVPSQLTPHRQYILGFTVYYGLSALIFLVLSLAGPEIVIPILSNIAGADSKLFSGLQDRSTFPIIVAFLMIGLYPNLRLPAKYDGEIWLRRIGHWIAYIPKNITGLVEQMEFAEFDVPDDTIINAWSLIDLKRPNLEAADLKSIGALLDRLVVLYVRAAAPAGDLESDDLAILRKEIGLDVFRQYRDELADVQSTIESVHVRLGEEELGRLTEADRRRTIRNTRRDIRKRLDFLYVVFASAISAKGSDRLEGQMRAIGFTSQFHSKQEIPWARIFKVIGLPAVVLFFVLMFSSKLLTTLKPEQRFYLRSFATDKISIVQQVIAIVVTFGVAIGFAESIRTRLINQDRYFTDKLTAYVNIAFQCYWVALLVYLGTYLISFITSPQPTLDYFLYFSQWAIVPALCGVLVAMSLDRPATNRYERVISGVKQGLSLGLGAWIVFVVTLKSPPKEEFLTTLVSTWPAQLFTFVVYSGFGFVIGAVLPTTIRTYREEQNQMPELIAASYNEVKRYFYDDGQFKEWLHTLNPSLAGKPPIDLLHEEGGMERLITFVTKTRKVIAPPS